MGGRLRSSQDDSKQDKAPDGSRSWAVLGVFSVFIVGGLSLHMVITGLPVIVEDFTGNQVQFTWMVVVTLLANAAFTPIWGKFADMVSKTGLFKFAGLLLATSCLVGGLAPNMEILLVARFFQGVALGGIGTLAMTIVAMLIPPRERGRYAGYIGMSLMVSAAGGPLLGGLITDYFGWRWCFLLIVPLASIGLYFVHTRVDLAPVRQRVQIDYLGSLLLVAFSSVILVWLSITGDGGLVAWLSWESATLAGSSALLLGFLVISLKKTTDPIISLETLLKRTPLLACVSATSIAVCMFALPPFLMQYFQMGHHLTPTAAGVMLFPYVVGNAISTTLTGYLISRFGKWKRYLVIGSIILTTAITALGVAVAWGGSLLLIGLLLFVAGVGFGAQLQNLMLVVQNSVEAHDLGQASSLLQFFRTFGGAVGSAVLGAVMAFHVGGLTQLDVMDPGQIQLYAEASAYAFFAAALLTLPAVATNLLLREAPLRSSL